MKTNGKAADDLPISRKKLLNDIDTFCDENGISPTDFGTHALNDSAFVGRLRTGLNPTLSRIERCYQFMKKAKFKNAADELLN